MYLVTDCWRGRLAIGVMRSFDNEADAIKYAATLGNWVRVYETYSDKPPRQIKFKV